MSVTKPMKGQTQAELTESQSCDGARPALISTSPPSRSAVGAARCIVSWEGALGVVAPSPPPPNSQTVLWRVRKLTGRCVGVGGGGRGGMPPLTHRRRLTDKKECQRTKVVKKKTKQTTTDEPASASGAFDEVT